MLNTRLWQQDSEPLGAVDPAVREAQLAELTIAILRDQDISDAEILSDYMHVNHQADRAYEEQVRVKSGVCIKAENVRSHMRRLLQN